MPTSAQERMSYAMLAQINQNVVKLTRLLEKIQKDGLKVVTQESHQP